MIESGSDDGSVFQYLNLEGFSGYHPKFQLCFPEKFKAYVEEKNLQHQDFLQNGRWRGCIFWSSQNESASDWESIKRKIKNLTNTDIIPVSCLIQFWRALEINGKFFLTTENQPFIISASQNGIINEEYCSYQMEISSKNYNIFSEYEEGGLVCKAFREQRIKDISCFLMDSTDSMHPHLLGVVEIRSNQLMNGNLCHEDLTKLVAYLQENSVVYSSWSEDVYEQVKSVIYTVGVNNTLHQSCIAINDNSSLQDCYRAFEECITDNTPILSQEHEIVKNPVGDNAVEMDTDSVSSPHTVHVNGKLTISEIDLQKQFGKSLNDAAKALGVSRSTLKRYCRQHGCKRWPRKRRKIPVRVKAQYGDNKYIEFKLFESSGIDELYEQVAKRLKKSYTVHYPNIDGEFILIACDDDLQTHISSSKILGNMSFNILLVQSDS